MISSGLIMVRRGKAEKGMMLSSEAVGSNGIENHANEKYRL